MITTDTHPVSQQLAVAVVGRWMPSMKEDGGVGMTNAASPIFQYSTVGKLLVTHRSPYNRRVVLRAGRRLPMITSVHGKFPKSQAHHLFIVPSRNQSWLVGKSTI